MNKKTKIYIKEGILSEEEYFTAQLSDEQKRGTKSYRTGGVIWYGTPGRMVVVDVDRVYSREDNIFDSDKLEYVRDMIRNSNEPVEFLCSYGFLEKVDFEDILESQSDDSYGKTYSIGDNELDRYIGDSDFISDEINSDSDILDILEEHKFEIAFSKITEDQFIEFVGEELYGEFEYEIDQFLEYEDDLKKAIDSQSGDLGNLMVKIRDGNHRIIGAKMAGAREVCIDITEDSLIQYKEEIFKDKGIRFV